MTTRRTEVKPFTDKQVTLLETFANQAVIAIENVRLFQELKESLEQQTATSEILGVIASSPTDIQPVLDTVAENAARVCGATDAVIFRIDGNSLNRAAHYGPILWAGGEESSAISRGLVAGRAVVDRRTIHIHDMATESETEFPEGLSFQKRAGHRTILATPLLREGIPIGTIMIRRTEVRPFSEKQIKLLETFATRPSSPSRMCGCLRNCRIATQNCARPWSIRRQPPRCSALSAARPQTCSRSSMPSSRARPGFVGLMTYCCDSARGRLWFCELILDRL